ncbi:MAG: PQQ-like beta-propeller repeat protein [Thermoplasmata archaeon]|nr:PQQ-like beta-propeller repeat protein [Thermoplasmata archaeon]MBE3141709.1 PQQ-like beta-propeller repeat protein [Thermoplasmata archaeon]
MNGSLVEKLMICGIIFVISGVNYGAGVENNTGYKSNSISTNESTSSSSFTTDWWPMYHHDLNLTGYSTSTAPKTNKVLWAAGTYKNFWYDPQRSSPAVVNDTIYIGVVDPSVPKSTPISHEIGFQKNRLPLKSPFNFDRIQNENPSTERWYEAYLVCMNATTGFEKWKTRLDDEYYIRGSPAVADGRVYITTTEWFTSPYGHLFCLDASTGSILWNFTLNGYEAFSPAVVNGKVYASGWILGENSSKICKLFCLDTETGIEVFNTTLGIGEPVDAAVLYNGRIYVSVWDDNAYETFLYCVNALNGTLYWNKNLPGNYLLSSPVIYNGKIFVISNTFDFQENVSCYIECFDAITGAPQWNRYIEGGANAWSTPAVAYNRIYFTVSHELYDISWLYCLDAATGDLIWNKFLTQDGVLYSSPAIADGKIYVNSMSYFQFHGYLYCLDATTGDNIWQYWLVDPIYSSPAIASGRLYLASRDYFYTFDDSAPSDNPPIVTITGPHYGVPGKEYNYTFLAEDPEEHDLLVIFEWSREWPEGYYMWVTPSGIPYVLTLPFEEEGEYWIRARAQDMVYYTWSNWTELTINISEPKQMFLLGFINHVEKENDYTLMNASLVFYAQFSPFKVGFLSPGNQIIILNNSTGYMGSRFIIGRFQATIG